MTATATTMKQNIQNANGIAIGCFEIEESTETQYLRKFIPGSGYADIEHYFAHQEELIDQMCLSLIDDASWEIAALELTLEDGSPLIDPMICANGDMSARIKPIDVIEMWEYYLRDTQRISA